jgi:hypothetical protein
LFEEAAAPPTSTLVEGVDVGNRSGTSSIVATYDYTDANGRLLYQVVRWGPEKSFSQRRPARPDDPTDIVRYDWRERRSWVWKVDQSLWTLYRLPRVIEAIRAGGEVWLPEGEKDVAALEAASVTATCNPGGAGKWRKRYAQELWRLGLAAMSSGGRWPRFVIVRDKDEPGSAHAQQVAWTLAEFSLPYRAVEAAEGKDAHDHLVEYGLGLERFVPVLVSAEPPNPRAFNGYARPKRRTHEVDWSAPVPEWKTRPVDWSAPAPVTPTHEAEVWR